MAKVLCEVESYPPPEGFHWTFNNSAESRELPHTLFKFGHHNFSSVLSYTPIGEFDYGTVMCSASNLAGLQVRQRFSRKSYKRLLLITSDKDCHICAFPARAVNICKMPGNRSELTISLTLCIGRTVRLPHHSSRKTRPSNKLQHFESNFRIFSRRMHRRF